MATQSIDTTSRTSATTQDMDWVDIEEAADATNDKSPGPKEQQETEEPTTDLKEEAAANASPSELDLVFIVDNTGSMGSWIRSAQKNVQKIIRDIEAAEATDVRFALVSYRDHPPQDSSFVTQTHDFTANIKQMQRWVDEMRAHGGGDGPEAVADGLYDASQLSYRPNSTKVAVLIADAPPHGLGCQGDGFPNGCPIGHDPLEIARSMAAKGITIYTVICGNFEGQAFYQGISSLTGGQYVPISSAHLLAGVIVGGAQEEISLERLMQDAQETVRAEEEAAGHQLDDDELASRLQGMFARKGGSGTRKTQFGGTDLPDFEGSAAHYSTASTLADVRKTEDKSHLSFGSYGRGIDTAPAMKGMAFATATADEAPSHYQCKRMVGKSRARGYGSSWSKKK